MTQLAEHSDPTLARWIEEHVGVPVRAWSTGWCRRPTTNSGAGRSVHRSRRRGGRCARSRSPSGCSSEDWSARCHRSEDVGVSTSSPTSGHGRSLKLEVLNALAHRGRALRPPTRPGNRRPGGGRPRGSEFLDARGSGDRRRARRAADGADIDELHRDHDVAIRQHWPRSSLCDRSPPIPATSCPATPRHRSSPARQRDADRRPRPGDRTLGVVDPGRRRRRPTPSGPGPAGGPVRRDRHRSFGRHRQWHSSTRCWRSNRSSAICAVTRCFEPTWFVAITRPRLTLADHPQIAGVSVYSLTPVVILYLDVDDSEARRPPSRPLLGERRSSPPCSPSWSSTERR